jgi:hypothetical protein
LQNKNTNRGSILISKNIILKSNKDKFIKYLFWFSIILYTNPGGIQQALNVFDLSGGMNFNDLLMPILVLCYAFTTFKSDFLDNDFNKVKIFLSFYLVYIIFIFGYFVPAYKESADYSFAFALIKLRYTVYNFLLFIFIYKFAQTSISIFFSVFVFSSLIILVLFIQSLFTGINILPKSVISRGFVAIDRNLMINYGLMPLIIPIGFISIFFNKLKIQKIYIYFAFTLMILIWILSVTRRQLFGVLAFMMIALLLKQYLVKRSFFDFKLLTRLIVIFNAIILITYFAFPKYINATKSAFVETENLLFNNTLSNGLSDERLSLTKPFIIKTFKENILFGTGFDNRWRTQEGDNEGFEAADYPFLAALAMTGIAGVLVFLPIYALLATTIIRDIMVLKNFQNSNSPLTLLLLLTLIIWFLFEFMQYMNYFKPVSNLSKYDWFCYLGLYLAVRKSYFSNVNQYF